MRLVISSAVLALLAAPGASAISRQECIDQGGVIVGDIGDGSIFSPDYTCEINGMPPTDPITPLEGEPIAIEGEICCGGTGLGIAYTMVDPLVVAERDELSREECMEANGMVVGDIGNGAIFEDDYVCESNGLPPIANIVSTEPPFSIEGEVCCVLKGISRQGCLDANGVIVGDIGDGAIFHADYVCESSGLPPIANIVNSEPPFAIEGEVCCAGSESAEASREQISRQECKKRGGEIVGDIGDGTIHKDDYICESNGEPPIAQVVPLEGEPIADEGEVCCGGADFEIEGEALQVHESNVEDGSSHAFSFPVVAFVASFALYVLN